MPRRILEQVINREITGYITQEIITEVIETFRRKFRYPLVRLHEIEQFLRDVFIMLTIHRTPILSRDSKDNHILAICYEVDLKYIVSGDKDLLVLEQYKGVLIVSVAEFLANGAR